MWGAIYEVLQAASSQRCVTVKVAVAKMRMLTSLPVNPSYLGGEGFSRGGNNFWWGVVRGQLSTEEAGWED